MENISYVLFDPSTGFLLGGYQQVPPEDHEPRIEVDDATRLNWPMFRANEARDGVELAPPAPAADTTRAVPASVTRRQARQALLLAGLLDHVSAALANLDDGTPEGKQQMRLAQIEWEDSLEFERARPLVAQIGAVIGLDKDGLDELFITASGL